MKFLTKSTNVVFTIIALLFLAGGMLWIIQSSFTQVPTLSATSVTETQTKSRIAVQTGPTSTPTDLPTTTPPPATPTSKIVFVDDLNGIRDLYLVNPDGSERTNLTEVLGPRVLENKPRWAKDGSRIYFSIEGDWRDNQDLSLKSIKPDGTDVVEHFEWPHQINSYDVSPDGQWVAYSANTLSTQGNPVCSIFKIRIDGSDLTRLTDEIDGPDAPTRRQCDGGPKWSPNGNLLLFGSNRRNPNGTVDKVNLYTMQADGSQLVQLTNREWKIFTTRWSPDGTQIAMGGTEERYGAGNIFVMDADGSNLRQVTNSTVTDEKRANLDYGHISWSPDGTKLVVQSSTNTALGIVDLTTGQETYPLIPDANMGKAFQPDWSPWLGDVPPEPTPTPGPPSGAVRPILECVEDHGNGSYTAHFGYLSENDGPVSLPIGGQNKFHPTPQDRGQPTVFQPGRTDYYPNAAFTIEFDGSNLVWTLNGRTSTASDNPAQRCR